MDCGHVEFIQGFLGLHNGARDPCQGGIPFPPQWTADAVEALLAETYGAISGKIEHLKQEQ